MSYTEHSMSIARPLPPNLNVWQKSGIAMAVVGVVLMMIYWIGNMDAASGIFLFGSLSLLVLGGLAYTRGAYGNKTAGIKNDGAYFDDLTSRGAIGWALGIGLTSFYVILYFKEGWMGLGTDGAENKGLVGLFDPLSFALKGQAASQWFVYGTLYTIAILVMGIKFICKYRHNRYQVLRTGSVMFFQLGFAFLLPEILLSLNLPYNDFKNIWPLNYYFFQEWNVRDMIQSGTIGMFMLVWGIALIFLISPILTFFYGKRWYCSWVCGCGGLAETAGDPFRHLSDKSLRAWKIERILIHSVLVFVVVYTIAIIYSYLNADQEFFTMSKELFSGIVIGIIIAGGAFMLLRPDLFTGLSRTIRNAMLITGGLIVVFLIYRLFAGGNNVFIIESYQLRKTYGFLIGAVFSGVIGVGFYPLMGSRVWCRFGCPMAAILGIQQKFFSRFRITSNGSQCISCGNCSAYCEMGIDVRWYAQRGQDVVRASCVGCGICAAVCPRGVLRLENGPDIKQRTTELRALHVDLDGVKLEH